MYLFWRRSTEMHRHVFRLKNPCMFIYTYLVLHLAASLPNMIDLCIEFLVYQYCLSYLMFPAHLICLFFAIFFICILVYTRPGPAFGVGEAHLVLFYPCMFPNLSFPCPSRLGVTISDLISSQLIPCVAWPCLSMYGAGQPRTWNISSRVPNRHPDHPRGAGLAQEFDVQSFWTLCWKVS